MIPASSELTLDTVAKNLAVLAPAGTVTEVGTMMAELLLESLTWRPSEGAAMLVVMVQDVDPASDIVAASHLRPLRSAEPEEPFPCNLTATATVEEELVITFS